jgi:hypothetical protein
MMGDGAVSSGLIEILDFRSVGHASESSWHQYLPLALALSEGDFGSNLSHVKGSI